jgi:hypothetical protein
MNNWSKEIRTWKIKNTLYISVVFTWDLEKAYKLKKEHKGKTIIGGPALMKPNQIDFVEPILFHNPLATFTTRGCPNKCGFCAVPKLEGDLKEIKDFRPAPIICDNNFLASSLKHIEYVIYKLKKMPFIDFNQGLDARLFTKKKAQILGSLNCKVRFSMDSWQSENKVKDAIDLCRKYTTNDIGVYCLIGYDDNMDEAVEKLEKIRSWGVMPNPMRYQPLNTKIKNSYISKNWTDGQLKKVMKYYSRLNYFEHIPFNEFKDIPDQGKLFE